MKHIFIVLILLIKISTMVSGQTDTINSVEEYKKYEGEYTTGLPHVDSSRINTKGLKWFLDCGTCDLFAPQTGVDFDEGFGFARLLKSFSVGLSASAASVRVREGFVSPVVYGGNVYSWIVYFEGTSSRFYWRNTYSFGWGKISPIKLNSSLNREDYRLSYKPFLVDLQAALRLKKSPHYLGASFTAEGFTIEEINTQNSFDKDLINSTIKSVNNEILYAGITHLYFNELYEIPFRTQVILSVLKTSTQPWGDSQFVDFSHTFKIDFMLNKKQRTKLMVGYTWNIFNQNKEDKFYRTAKSSSSLRLTWTL